MNPLQVHAESVEQAKRLLQMPPVLPVRQPRKSVIEVDKKLAEAIENRYIFTETTHHKDDKVRMCVYHKVLHYEFIRTTLHVL